VTATSVDPPTSELVTVTVSTSGTVVRVTAAGEVDSTSAPVLREQIDAVIDSGAPEFVVDLVQVTFLDSAGLCVLAAAHRRAGERGIRMRVFASSRAVIRPLQITGLWSLLGASEVSAQSGAA
jgi:anti-sigma B factor antagonist